MPEHLSEHMFAAQGERAQEPNRSLSPDALTRDDGRRNLCVEDLEGLDLRTGAPALLAMSLRIPATAASLFWRSFSVSQIVPEKLLPALRSTSRIAARAPGCFWTVGTALAL